MKLESAAQPPGATHFGPACQHLSNNWFKLEDGEWSVWSIGYGWTECRDGLQPLRLNTMVELKPAPWSGKGKPPVGKATCEYRGAHQYDIWTVVNIFAHWGQDVFVDYGDGWRAERDLSRFRPIRTPEQIAAEKRDAKAKELFYTINWDSDKDCWDRLLDGRKNDYRKAVDAGWQKVPRA